MQEYEKRTKRVTNKNSKNINIVQSEDYKNVSPNVSQNPWRYYGIVLTKKDCMSEKMSCTVAKKNEQPAEEKINFNLNSEQEGYKQKNKNKMTNAKN